MSEFIWEHFQRRLDRDLPRKAGLVGMAVKGKIPFMINTDGKTTGITAIGINKELNLRTIDIIASLPKVQPASQDGKDVNVTYNLPYSFFISEK